MKIKKYSKTRLATSAIKEKEEISRARSKNSLKKQIQKNPITRIQ